MKKIILSVALIGLAATSAQAEHWDVIGSKLKDDCPMAKYMAIVKDFNEWGKAYGYKATVLTPIQDNDQQTIWWIGRSANAAKFGAAWDAWRNGQAEPNSGPAKLQARFSECATNTSRSGYDAW